MGSMTMLTGTLFGSLSDFVGAKSGLALNRGEINKLLTDHNGYTGYNEYADGIWVRIESVTYEEMAETLLFGVGRLEERDNYLPVASLFKTYGREGANAKLAIEVAHQFTAFMKKAVAVAEASKNIGARIEPSPFLQQCYDQHGKLGAEMAMIVIKSFGAQLLLRGALAPDIERCEDVIALKDLFESEGLEAQYGEFFDRRYIDYLHRNFKDIVSRQQEKIRSNHRGLLYNFGFSFNLVHAPPPTALTFGFGPGRRKKKTPSLPNPRQRPEKNPPKRAALGPFTHLYPLTKKKGGFLQPRFVSGPGESIICPEKHTPRRGQRHKPQGAGGKGEGGGEEVFFSPSPPPCQTACNLDEVDGARSRHRSAIG